MAPRERLAAVARRHVSRAAPAGAPPRRGGAQAVRHRQRELHRRLARVLPRLLRSPGASCSASTPATSIPPSRSPTRSRACSSTCPRSCCTSAAACAGTATMWSRSTTTCLAIAREIVATGGPRADPHRPRLLRRQHQPRGRLGDRRPQPAEGPAGWPARAAGDPRGRGGRRPHGPTGPPGRGQDAARRRGLGRLLRDGTTCPSATAGSARCGPTNGMSQGGGHERRRAGCR